MVVVIHSYDHFEAMNDFVCFQRHKVKDYEWFHRGLDATDCSTLTIEFFDPTEAMLFKLKYG